jgi:hypothetical protein
MPQTKAPLPSVAILAIAATACNGASQPPAATVEATYDRLTGKLSQLTVNANPDGKPNVYSYMDGGRFIRIEIDKDENGTIDRWEYYDAGQKLQKVGISRSNDGIADAWLYQGPSGILQKVEVSTRRDGSIDRTEFYVKGELARAEEDSDADGRIDKWERYAGGALATVSFDTTRSGKPTVTVDYLAEKQ